MDSENEIQYAVQGSSSDGTIMPGFCNDVSFIDLPTHELSISSLYII